MKLKQSRPLASRASHWPPVSSRGGNSDGGEGYGFSVTVCAQRGAKSGSGAAGFFFMAQTWPSSDPESAHVWPRFSPDLARINTITCMWPSWLATERRACKGSVVVGGGVIWGAMHDQQGAQISMREQVEELSGVKIHRKKKTGCN